LPICAIFLDAQLPARYNQLVSKQVLTPSKKPLCGVNSLIIPCGRSTGSRPTAQGALDGGYGNPVEPGGLLNETAPDFDLAAFFKNSGFLQISATKTRRLQ
jgi:hypothetical protein